MDISDSQIKEVEQSLERTEQRRAAAEAARQRQKRAIVIVLALLVLLVVLGGMMLGAMAGRQVPKISTVALTWPHGEKEGPLDAQLVGNGSRVLIKAGQPLRFSVPQTDVWDVAWKTPDVQSSGDTFDWTPSSSSGQLIAAIQPRLSGWKKMFSFGKGREIQLIGLAGTTPQGQKENEYLHDIETPEGGIWMHYRVLAEAPLRYDDRAIKAFGEAANQIGEKQGDAVTADAPIWQLIPIFSGDKAIPNDNGTNALLKTANPAEDAHKAFAILNRLEPKATIKVIVVEGKTAETGEARFRLIFDGKGGRFVWVQGEGDKKAKPKDWTREKIRDEKLSAATTDTTSSTTDGTANATESTTNTTTANSTENTTN